MSDMRCPECGGTWNASGPEDHAPGCRKAPTMANAYQTLREAGGNLGASETIVGVSLGEHERRLASLENAREGLFSTMEATAAVCKTNAERVTALEQRVQSISDWLKATLQGEGGMLPQLATIEWRLGSLERHWGKKPEPIKVTLTDEQAAAMKIEPGHIERVPGLMEGADSSGRKPLTRDQYLYGIMWRSAIQDPSWNRRELLAAIGGQGSKAQHDAIAWACSVLPPPDDIDVWTLDEAAKPATLMEGADTKVGGYTDGPFATCKFCGASAKRIEDVKHKADCEKFTEFDRDVMAKAAADSELTRRLTAQSFDYYGRRTADGRGFAVVKEEAPARRRRKWWRLWL